MPTIKTVNVTNGKFLNYQVSKAGYKSVTGSIYVDGDKTVNVKLVSTSSSGSSYEFGDRILGMATFVCYYTPGGNYDNKPISTAVASQTTGSGLQNLGVKKSIFESLITTTGNYEFSYDGTNWSYDGNTVNLSDYGIFFNTDTSTLTSGDVITISYTVYNKYAVFVLDANYRTNLKVSSISYQNESARVPVNCPIYSSVNSGTGSSETIWYYNQLSGQESATWTNECILNNQGWAWSTLPGYLHCRNIGTFVLTNGIQITPVIPNLSEGWQIMQNRVNIDALDPVIQSGTTTYNLTNMNFRDGRFFSCQKNTSTDSYKHYNVSTNSINTDNGTENYGIVPVFEVPVL